MPGNGRTGAVIVAAGRSERMGGLDKVLAPLGGTALVLHSVRAFQESEEIDEIVLVTRPELEERLHRMVEDRGFLKVRRVVRGGATRAESSRHGVGALSEDVAFVLVHDAARPLVTPAVVTRVVDAVRTGGAAIPGLPPASTIKREVNGASAGTIERASLREAQTPQGFRRDLLARAFAAAMKDGFRATDEAAMVERLGERVVIVPGDRRNLKITVPEDLHVAEALLAGGVPPARTRVGFGFDVHRLVPGRPLVLGGVAIEHPAGLEGHSDADVLSHAVCDALFGAASAGDLGTHFPDTEPKWKDASGERLLAATVEILLDSGYVPVHVDATVTAQEPKLAPHRDAMIANLARALRLPEAQVSVKFTTTERLGFEGRGEGISATAVAQVGCTPLLLGGEWPDRERPGSQ